MSDDLRMINDRYAIRSELGTGGAGTVWRAHDLQAGRDVAVKEIRPGAGTTPAEREEASRRAMAEIRYASRLSHPNIVAVEDSFVHDGAIYIVMPLIDGPTLHSLVRTRGPLPPDQAARMGLALLGALSYAHAAGVIHRDVKPSNVLIGAGDAPMLSDFSISTATGTTTITRTGAILGSPGYIAPERILTGRAGPEADLFALGATLYFAVEGQGPFESDDTLLALIAPAQRDHPAPVRAGRLAPVLDGLLAKDPAVRWTADEAGAALAAVASGQDIPLPTVRRQPASTVRRQRPPTGSGDGTTVRQPARVGRRTALGAIVVAALGAVGFGVNEVVQRTGPITADDAAKSLGPTSSPSSTPSATTEPVPTTTPPAPATTQSTAKPPPPPTTSTTTAKPDETELTGFGGTRPLWVEKAYNAFGNFGMSVPDAQALADAWAIDVWSFKIGMGNSLRTGQPHGANEVSASDINSSYTFRGAVVGAYQSSGFGYNDALRLAPLWGSGTTGGAKFLIGVRVAAGQAVE